MRLELEKHSGELVTVEAFQTPVPEIVCHRSLNGQDHCWTLTHKPSGLKVSVFPLVSRIQAVRIAERLAGLDWHFDRATAPRGEALEPYLRGYQAALDAEAGRADCLPNVKKSRGVPHG